jgi:hypothetical protein
LETQPELKSLEVQVTVNNLIKYTVLYSGTLLEEREQAPISSNFSSKKL